MRTIHSRNVLTKLENTLYLKRAFLTSFLGLSQLSPVRQKRELEIIHLAYGT